MYEGDFLAESRKLAEGIQNIAGKKLLDKHGNPLYSGRTVGYVCNVYPEGDEWEGTIDVQEFNKNYDDEKADVGLHEHVRISAIQNNKSGVLLVPQLYSEVVIVQDPASQEEYVISFSHVDVIQMNSHQKASIGVTETEEFVEDQDDDKDFDNLEKTGSSAHTYYDKDSITDIVTEHDKEGDDETKNQDGTVSRKVTKDKIVEQIGEKTTLTTENTKRTLQIGDNLTIVMDGSGKIDINANGTTVTIDSKGQSTKIGGSDSAQITVDNGGNVIVGEAADNAVLFSELNTLLSKLFSYLASALTATQIGPQPLSTGPQIGALSGELPKIMSQKVKIAK